ncbi:RDD family protein [Tolumonas lignilytica]|uniref:RDD family protein n=1 Tax=Tolumonas lignilytica TaxID=1283284 RepID=UPI0004633CD1|nr:RDD family protein [Tolumonas lignilytica]
MESTIENDDYVQDKFCTLKRRIIAACLDSAALAPFAWFDKYLWNSISNPLTLQIWNIFYTAVIIYYYYYFVARFGQTPGKMASGIKILTSNECEVGPKHAVLRQILFSSFSLIFLTIQLFNLSHGMLTNRALGNHFTLMLFGSPILFLSLLEFITMMCNTKRRSIHDFIADTVVIKFEETKHKNKIKVILLTLFIINLLIQQFIPELNLVTN